MYATAKGWVVVIPDKLHSYVSRFVTLICSLCEQMLTAEPLLDKALQFMHQNHSKFKQKYL